MVSDTIVEKARSLWFGRAARGGTPRLFKYGVRHHLYHCHYYQLMVSDPIMKKVTLYQPAPV